MPRLKQSANKQPRTTVTEFTLNRERKKIKITLHILCLQSSRLCILHSGLLVWCCHGALNSLSYRDQSVHLVNLVGVALAVNLAEIECCRNKQRNIRDRQEVNTVGTLIQNKEEETKIGLKLTRSFICAGFCINFVRR